MKLSFPLLILSLLALPHPAAAKAKPSVADDKAALEELRLVEGDEDGNEVKSLKTELLVRRSEDHAIAQALRLLKRHQGDDLEAELIFRLAELYMRRSKGDRFFEVHRESETVVKLAPRLVKEASSKESVSLAIDKYADLEARFPQFSQMDLVIFNHAFARQSLGQEPLAEVLYQKLINEHSSSPLVPDAHLAIGEIAFTRAQFPVALEHFNAIKKYPESRVYPYGLYKAGWTLYNMRDAEKGLKKLEEVVAFGKFVQQNKTDARLDLRKEALNDMTLFYEDVFPAKDGYKYFLAQAGPDEVGPILLRLAHLYERHSRFNDQRVALQEFSEELPKSPLLISVSTDLILAFDHLKDKDQAVEGMKHMADLCKTDGRWVRAQNKKTDEAKALGDACVTALNDTSLKLAKKWLKAWKKLPTDPSYADASERAFEVYLKTPGQTDERAEANYAYADLLFARKKYREASVQYAEVARAAKPGKLGHDASYGAVVSLEKAVGDSWSGADEGEFRTLAGEYVRKNPNGAYRLDLEYKMALLAYEKGRLDEAAPIFLRLGHDFAGQDKGVKSQDLYLDILNQKKDYKGVRGYAAGLLQTALAPERSGKMKRLYEQAYFLEIQGLEEKGRLAAALAEYIAFLKQNPTSELAEKATYNTMELQFKTGDAFGGAKTADAFADRYPKSIAATDVLMRAAQSFEQMGQLKSAARVLEKLSTRDQKSAARWKELAADFYALDGEGATARKLYAELLGQAGDAEARRHLVLKQDALEKNYGTPESQAQMRKILIEQNVPPIASSSRVEQVEALLRQGDRPSEAFNAAKHALAQPQMPNDLKARLRLVQAKVLEEEFLRASVKARAERVGTVLAIKTEKLTKAQEALTAAIKYGSPRVSIEAFERLYGCYRSYVQALKEMPVPAGLTDADAKAFRAELDNLLVPLEEKSVETLAQAVQFAKTQSFLDGTTARLEEKLNALNGQAGVKLDPALSEPELALPVLAGVN